MLFMSKVSSAPSSEAFNKPFILFKRSLRSRSKLIRSSQSTAIVPYVFSATVFLLIM